MLLGTWKEKRHDGTEHVEDPLLAIKSWFRNMNLPNLNTRRTIGGQSDWAWLLNPSDWLDAD